MKINEFKKIEEKAISLRIRNLKNEKMESVTNFDDLNSIIFFSKLLKEELKSDRFFINTDRESITLNASFKDLKEDITEEEVEKIFKSGIDYNESQDVFYIII